MSGPVTFDLRLPAGPPSICRVRVGRGVLDCLVNELVAESPGGSLVLIADDNVAPLHGGPLASRLRGAGLDVRELQFPHGEANKTRANKAALEDELLRMGLGRDGALIAVGGGVTGDLVGFLAATWHRGIPVVQVPTSLLAMADAALGGKTAVDLGTVKNAIGCFHQPWGVYADIATLSTLPADHYTAGFAEVVKTAAIADITLFRRLERQHGELLTRDATVLAEVLGRCMAIKARVVRRDEREAGRRAMLNFGHTVGHAIETGSDYAIAHGPAVAIGMCVEARLAEAATGFPGKHRRRLEGLLQTLRLPTTVPSSLDVEALVAATRRDKKVRAGQVYYALPTRLGRMPPGSAVSVSIDEGVLRAALRDAGGGD